MTAIIGGRIGLRSTLAIAVTLLTVGSGSASAAPGDLDPSFSGDGKVVVDFGFGGESWADAVALQPDGKIVVVGTAAWDFAVARFNPDGTFDTTFSGDGWTTTTFDFLRGQAATVAIQPDGKIVVGGRVGDSLSYTDFALARFDSDGSLDTSFDGDGKVRVHFWDEVYDREWARIEGLAIQPDDKIVAAGSASSSFGDVTLMRFTGAGAIDGSFGTDGLVMGDFESDLGRDVALQSDGRIVVVGSAYRGAGGDDLMIARYESDGSADTSFAGGGKTYTDLGHEFDSGHAVAIQDDGKIVAAGESGGFVLVRYSPDGSPDSDFSGDGVATGFGPGLAFDVALQPDGRIVAAGSAEGESYPLFAVARYGSDGSLDGSFSGDGRASTDFGGEAYARDVAIQPDGKIVAVGSAVGAFVLTRYLVDGNANPNPGGGGAGSGGGGGSGGEPVRQDTSRRAGPAEAACSKARTARGRAQSQLKQARRKLSAAKRKAAKRKAKRTVKRRQQALSKATKRAKRICGTGAAR